MSHWAHLLDSVSGSFIMTRALSRASKFNYKYLFNSSTNL